MQFKWYYCDTNFLNKLSNCIIDIIWSKNYAFKHLKYDAVFFVDQEYYMDQNNFNRIHRSVRRTLIYKYAKELSEDQVYSINKFSVAFDSWSYRTTRQG